MSLSQLTPFVRRLAERAQARAFNYMAAKPRSQQDLREAWVALAGVYADSAALLTADWYRQQDSKSKFSPGHDSDLADQKLDDITSWVFKGPQTPENRAKVAAHRLVFDAARRTVFVNAAQEGVAIARQEPAGSCRKCAASATLTARDRNSSSEDVEQFFHPSCEGMFVPIRSGLYAPPDYTKPWREKVAEARRAGRTNVEDIALWWAAH